MRGRLTDPGCRLLTLFGPGGSGKTRLAIEAALGVAKPEAPFFHQVTRALGLPGEAILFWDDSPTNIEAARACGWQAERYVGWEDLARRMESYLPGAIR